MQLAIRRGCLRETIATINLMVSHTRTHISTFLKKKYRLKLGMQDSLSLSLSLLSLTRLLITQSLTLLLIMSR